MNNKAESKLELNNNSSFAKVSLVLIDRNRSLTDNCMNKFASARKGWQLHKFSGYSAASTNPDFYNNCYKAEKEAQGFLFN